MKRRLLPGFCLLTLLVFSVCLSPLFTAPAHAASVNAHVQSFEKQAASPAISNCYGPIVLTIVTNGSETCWYTEGYSGTYLTNVTYVHADVASATHGWFLVYWGGTSWFQYYSANQTFTFSPGSLITQICLVC